jgi:uncharacterized protein (DUF111 family)
MKLLINPEGGMAGDMFSAALVSAGADFNWMQEVMSAAGEKLGTAKINKKTAPDGALQLDIQLDSNRHHLGGNEARDILTELFERFNIHKTYRDLGIKILDILVKAEVKAHKEFNIVVESDFFHHHHEHPHTHDHGHNHNHDHKHSHPHSRHDHSNEEESFLHEAQDIVIDIMGATAGMQSLDIEPKAELLTPVSVGGGHVHCSHGRLSIPAPATTVILREQGIEWKKGPVDVELLTPTGGAILAALGSPVNTSADVEKLDIKAVGTARGTKMLEIPPLKFFVC